MRIQNKLFLVSIAGSALLVAVMFVLMQWGVDRGLLAYINIRDAERWQPVIERLSDYYEKNGSWRALEDNDREFHNIIRRNGPSDSPQMPGPPPSGRSGPSGNSDRGPDRGPGPPRGGPPRRQVLLADTNEQVIIGRRNESDSFQLLEIGHENNIVGYLLVPKRNEITEDFELNFLSQQRESFMLISIVVLLLSAISSLPLARQIVAPIKRLASATSQLTKGDYRQLKDTRRKDELGDLTRDFNVLSQTLEKNDTARKRWLADTSHELRTPIAIVRGELEAMLDGVRPLDEKSVHSALQEVLHLSKLVDDLHELSNSDIGAMRYRMEGVDLRELVEETVEQHHALLDQQALRLVIELPDNDIVVHGDHTRLNQLLSNLLSNSIKYTEAKGQVNIKLQEKENSVFLVIEDSAPGVEGGELNKLFDYLYRVENSRNRKTGGSGLGLAICQRIAEAHGGSLSASHSKLGGVAISLQLPLK